MQVRFTQLAVSLALGGMLFAQTGDKTPRGEATATLGGKKLTLDYGRPQLKGRALAELLKQLPADRIWRAGENEVSTLSTETALLVGDKRVPAGKYSVYVHAPASGAWSLVLNSDPGIPLVKLWSQAPPEKADQLWPRLDGYHNIAGTEVARAAMKTGKVAAPVESFTAALSPSAGGATLNLSWGDQSWSLELKPAR